MFYPANDADADLVEQIKRDGDENQGHQVGRGDDGSYQHNDDKRMLAIAGKQIGSDNAQHAKEEGYHRQLEHYAHDQCQRYKRGDIRIECYVAHHLCRNTIGAEETEGDREQHKVKNYFCIRITDGKMKKEEIRVCNFILLMPRIR